MKANTETLTEAARNFCRPPDERYSSLEAIAAAALRARSNGFEVDIDAADLIAASASDQLFFSVGAEVARPGSFGFESVCRRIGAPHRYLATLPIPLVESAVNFGLRQLGNVKLRGLLETTDTGPVLRALTSQKYDRVWDSEIIGVLSEHAPGFSPAMESALRGTDGEEGAPRALYRGDRDSFLFLVDEDDRFDDGSPEGLARGFWVSNSEVGYRAITFSSFLYRFICANHLVWGANVRRSFRQIHVGENGHDFLRELPVWINELRGQEGRDRDVAIVRAAIAASFAETEEAAVERLVSMREPAAFATRAVELAKEDGYVNPLSCYGIVQGMTAAARDSEFAEGRVAIEERAGRVLELALR